MKLGLVTKLAKNKAMLKKSVMTSGRQIVKSLSFLRFMANLEQSGSWIPDACSVKVTFLFTVIFSLT